MNDKLIMICQYIGYIFLSLALVFAGIKIGMSITVQNNCESLGGSYIKHPETNKMTCVSIDILEKCSYVKSSNIYCGVESNENRT